MPTETLPLTHVPPEVEQLKVVVRPRQTLAVPVIVAASGLTLTITLAVPVQPLPVVPVTVYVVVTVGLAVVLAQVGHESAVAGDQL